MTTMVRIDAHVPAEKEVHVVIKEKTAVLEDVMLQDGEMREWTLLDDHVFTVREVLRK